MKKQTIKSKQLSWQPDAGKDPILKDISIMLEPGHVYGIIGPNGAGKSSFLKHLLGLLQVQGKTGAVFIGEKELRAYTAKELARELAFVPQKTDMDTDFTAQEVVMTGRYPYQSRWGGETEKDRLQVKHAMEIAGCLTYAEQPFYQLSGGEAQKVIIARAIAQDTGWVFLDEPVSSLDIRNQIEILRQLMRLNQENGISVVMVLHDVNLAAAYCDRLIMLKAGQVVYAGDTNCALTEERLEELYEIGFFTLRDEKGNPFFYPKR